MPRARRHSTSPESSTYSEADDSPPPSKRQRTAATKEDSESNRCLSGIKIHILPPKLSAEKIASLVGLLEIMGASVVSAAEKADVIVTGTTMKQRFLRHLDWDTAVQKAIVTPEWVEESSKAKECLPWGPYAALQEHTQDAKKPWPPNKDRVAKLTQVYESAGIGMPSSTKPADLSGTAARVSKDGGIKFTPKYESGFSCERHSPLLCPNQGLVDQLHIIRKAREIEGEKRSATSYSRAIGSLKAYPHQIRDVEEVRKLHYIGPKTLGMIQEYLDGGEIHHAREIVESEKYQTLMRFTSVYGIGPTTAKKLYDLGLRSFGDLERYSNVNTDDLGEAESLQPNMPQHETHGAKRLTWAEGLRIRDDLNVKIPRAEVEEIGRVVKGELDVVLPGSEYTICGGYRRGKQESNDVDIVFTHPAGTNMEEVAADLCTKLVLRLQLAGMITHVMHLPSFRNRKGLPQRPKNRDGWDTLEKALTVLRLPSTNENGETVYGLHRRVDLIYAPRDVYWTAVVGWTGSHLFERDIRTWAKRKKQMKFDSSGITRLRDTAPILARSEKEVFDILGLEWIDPVLRNAD